MVDPRHIAEAYIKVAKQDHYLVAVLTRDLTYDSLVAAEQILITMDNAADNQDPVLNLALDMIEQDMKAALAKA